MMSPQGAGLCQHSWRWEYTYDYHLVQLLVDFVLFLFNDIGHGLLLDFVISQYNIPASFFELCMACIHGSIALFFVELGVEIGMLLASIHPSSPSETGPRRFPRP